MIKRLGTHAALGVGLLVLATMATAAQQDRGLVRVPAPVGPEGQIRELYAGSYALLVGVAQYQDRVAWSSLGSIPDELQDLEESLTAQGFEVVQRVMNPTGAEMRRAIDEFIGRYGFNPGNRLFFFFAGATDRAAIEQTLNEYRFAYEARSVARLQQVFPTLPNPTAVTTAFAEAREVLVGMSPAVVRIASATEATATSRLNQSFVPRVGVARAAPTRDVTFTLRKESGRWIIVSLR